MARAFVTGASGFVGRVVCQRLRDRGHVVTGLTRRAATATDVVGDLLDPATYESALSAVDVVIHLAAVTGKAPPADYDRVNVNGTRMLLAAAERAGVTRFLFFSSIAVKFSDTRRYFYAQSKVAAERLVLGSRIAATIVRPTIIAGAGSPVMSRLASLAGLPVVPAFGGARARVQPIHVGDLADFVAAIVDSDRFRGEVLEFGGPEALTLRQLLDRLHRRLRGRPARFVPVPLVGVLPLLTVLEQIAFGVVPITVGQLATFRFDGEASPNDLWTARRSALATVDDMIATTATV